MAEPSGRLRPGSVGPHGDTLEEDPTTRMILGAMGHHDDDVLEEEDDEDADETFTERLVGLTEMFPETVCNFFNKVVTASYGGSKWLYNISRVGVWVIASSATILALPVMFENERTSMEEQQMQQQRQILLGPNVAMSGHMAPGLPHGSMPPMPQVTPPSR